MSHSVFRIRTAILVPAALNTLLLGLLFGLSLIVQGTATERGVLGLLFGVMLLFSLEMFLPQASVFSGGLVLKRFFRQRSLAWPEITHVGLLTVRRRVYLLLTTVKGFFVLSNAYAHHARLLNEIIAEVGEDHVEEAAKEQAAHPTINRSDSLSMWFAATVITGILLLKLFSLS